MLDPGVSGYFAGGAGDERTLRENVAAFGALAAAAEGARRRLWGDHEHDGARRAGVAMPILVAPVAFQRARPPGRGGGDGSGRVAGAGTVMCLSTLATARPGEVASAAPDGRGFGFSSTASATGG